MTTDKIQVLIKMIDHKIPIPSYQNPGDAGADLCTTHDILIYPGKQVSVNTGVAIALPCGYVGLVHPRSGLAFKKGITIVNAPGVIDSGYRGEIKVCLLNTSFETVDLKRGDRVAQLLIQEFKIANFLLVDNLPDSFRGNQGIGSTGGFMSSKRS